MPATYHRKVRTIVIFTCTTCYLAFPSSSMAKEHARTHPAPAKEKRETQTGAILDAIRAGSTTAIEISKKTKIPLERVHSLLSYHRRRGNVRGFTGKLRAAKDVKAGRIVEA